jgi:LacI family transcriptional regulator
MIKIRKSLTRKDIAEAAGVSPSTVSRALAGSSLLPQSTIDHVRKIAEQMGYCRNVLGMRMAANKSFQLGFVVPLNSARRGTFQLSYYSNILDAMVNAAYQRNYSITIHPYESGEKKQVQNLCNLVTSKQVDGLIFVGLTQNSKIPGKLVEAGIPFALLGSRSSLPEVISVNCNPYPGQKKMLQTLGKKGYKKLYFVHGNQSYYDAITQKKTLLKLLEKSKIQLAEILEGDYSRRSGYRAAEHILKKKLKDHCVFLANDRMAVGFYRYCQEHGITIPTEIGVIGSDNDEAATALYPDLTTIQQPRTAMGKIAVEMLIDSLQGKLGTTEPVCIEKSFIERQSI